MAMTTMYSAIDSPLGRLCVQGDGQFVTGLFLPAHKGWKGPDPGWRRCDSSFRDVRQQLDEYFSGERRQFDLPLKLTGTPFQLRVWRELAAIPLGETITYAQLAQRIGQPTASRAVGHANGRNPISIIVPCHRVIGVGGKLTGYGGGVDAKRWLLDWERSLIAAEPSRAPLAPPVPSTA